MSKISFYSLTQGDADSRLQVACRLAEKAFRLGHKIFIQVNIRDEKQKSGVNKLLLPSLYSYCKSLNLNVIGLMCIPPLDGLSINYFKEMNILNKFLKFSELSMGMSSDFLLATKYSSTYVRIGSSIFGQRS